MGSRLQRSNEPIGIDLYGGTGKTYGSNKESASVKRVFDFALALIALIFLAPFIALFALFIWMQDGKAPIFGHNRYGKNGRVFRCYKLRSMVPDAKEQLAHILATDPAAKKEWDETQKLTNDPRITRLGKFIRATSIDELPQLWNIIRGDMAIVGPRPIVQNEIAKYGEWFGHYSSVRPGLTGLWQIKGRSDTTYEERIAFDVEYVQNQSFMNDLVIIIRTVPAILMSRGAV